MDSEQKVELARRLHDGLAQDLAALGYSLDLLIANPDLPQYLRSEAREIRLAVSSITENFRDEIFLLRQLDRSMLQAELHLILQSLSVEISLDFPALPSNIEDSLGRAILEIARNTVKHSGASRFALSWTRTVDVLQIALSDNGVGGWKMKERSLGLKGINEYLMLADIQMEVTSDASGNSYRLSLHIPRQ